MTPPSGRLKAVHPEFSEPALDDELGAMSCRTSMMAGYETWSSRGQPLAVFLWVGTRPQLIPTGHTPFDQHRTDSTRHQRRWYLVPSTISVFSPACRGLSPVEVVVSVVGVVEIGTRRFPSGSTASASFLWSRRVTFVICIIEYRCFLLVFHTIGSSGWQNEVKLLDMSKVVKRGGGTAKSGRRESLGMRREM